MRLFKLLFKNEIVHYLDFQIKKIYLYFFRFFLPRLAIFSEVVFFSCQAIFILKLELVFYFSFVNNYSSFMFHGIWLDSINQMEQPCYCSLIFMVAQLPVKALSWKWNQLILPMLQNFKKVVSTERFCVW